jgi:allantoicase
MKDFTQLADLAAERLGGKVLAANDDFFAPKENLLKDSKPVFVPGKFTSRGKWMDGWESRRRRTPGHDWCIIRLGLPGIVRGVVVDTSFFTGNFPERFSLEGCDLADAPPKNEKKKLSSANLNWVQIAPETALKGDSQNLFPVKNDSRFTHLRLKIYPDGGVARLRVHGEAVPDAGRVPRGAIDLAAVENGGSVVVSSDQFYGAPRNLLMPYAAKNMGDGWETKRRRGPGHDWVILKLGVPGAIRRIEVNTAHFKGNFPESCSLETCHAKDATVADLRSESHSWSELLPRTKLKANSRHIFRALQNVAAATHVRFHIYPDGGVSRLRLYGRAEHATDESAQLKKFNGFSKAKAKKALIDCCGSKRWAGQMAARMPVASVPALLQAADDLWKQLTRADWLEAFQHHPPIGGKRAKAKQSSAAKKWSAGEQAASRQASAEALAALAVENLAYAEKFGYVFLICAMGKTSEEILNSLRERMSNSPEDELNIAAEEQRKITRLRLEKLLKP